jgi:hypothetical protein
MEDALGQLVLYRYLLRQLQPGRELFLAVRRDVYDSFISQPHVTEFLQAENVRLLIFDPQTEGCMLSCRKGSRRRAVL